MRTFQVPARSSSNPVDEARVAIWRLFQEGYVDEDMATASLLAVDLGTRRTQRKAQLADLTNKAVGDSQAHVA